MKKLLLGMGVAILASLSAIGAQADDSRFGPVGAIAAASVLQSGPTAAAVGTNMTLDSIPGIVRTGLSPDMSLQPSDKVFRERCTQGYRRCWHPKKGCVVCTGKKI